MYDLESIVAQNRRAEKLGIIKAGYAVGTTGFVPHNERKAEFPGTKGHSEDQGGLQGHYIGDTYPWQVAGGFDEGVTTWTVTNYRTGENGHTYRGLPENPLGCAAAHHEAELRKSGAAVPTPVTTLNPEY